MLSDKRSLEHDVFVVDAHDLGLTENSLFMDLCDIYEM